MLIAISSAKYVVELIEILFERFKDQFLGVKLHANKLRIFGGG